jgi:arylsulfatase A-like enzyme
MPRLLPLLLIAVATTLAAPAGPERPNVLIILTDDQGYGDLGAHGHPFLKTPNMDKLHAESVRFTDFHVAPMCSPTRGQLMTGVDAMKNGDTAVCQGRSMVREEIPMLPKYFADAGYATGIFGKWHMGDSYPHRPQDRGFQEVLSFRAWGLPALASNWKNIFPPRGSDSYTDPVLEHNGVDTPYQGFSGDIWFTEAMKFMERCKQENKPFFVYLPDNLAHSPDLVPEKYSKPYADMGSWKGTDGKEVKIPSAYYGQIANIDENMGRLEEFLQKSGLKENTIVIFLSDNGTRSTEAMEIYNAGMRGHKTEMWEGGHRVPCFFRWPQSGIKTGRDITELTEVQDIAPTLLDLCGIKPIYPMNGVSWSGLLRDEPWPHAKRNLAIQYRVSGKPWDSAVALFEKWRLLAGNGRKNPREGVTGTDLYNVTTDPSQNKIVAAENPEVLGSMNASYNDWNKAAFEEFQKPRYIHLGHPGIPEVILYSSDWQGDYCDSVGQLVKGTFQGAWDIVVEAPGEYHVELSRWPFEADKTLTEGSKGPSPDPKSVEFRPELDPALIEPQNAAIKGSRGGLGALPIAKAQLLIQDYNQTIATKPGDKTAGFDVPLKAGTTTLTANFLDDKGAILGGAMYVKVTKK